MAPAGFLNGDDDDDHHGNHHASPVILVGNFGDGRINAFNADGDFLGQLRGNHGQPLVIDGLWALMFPPSTSPINPNKLFFAAGPDDENDGLFGYLLPRQDDDDDD